MREQTDFARFVMVMIVFEFVRNANKDRKDEKKNKPFTKTAQIFFLLSKQVGNDSLGPINI